MTLRKIFTLLFVFYATVLAAQQITVKDTVYRTYPFSDPDPVPQTSGIYPYYKFGKFAFESENRTWKMVVLENDFLRVKILPEIGGKIWSVYDKVQGKEMFYDNDVVKFREIALRGPWTSGGIEFNYGVIGHAPSCSHPVDFKTEYKEDGSVSCFIGVQELLTRTRWMVEINLPKNAVWVRTRSFWHNYSGVFQPYYTWANSGVRVSERMKLIFPAAYTIAHSGETSLYPVDEEGRNLSKYSSQAFGIDKSYHPGGSHKNYFGTYWEEDSFGMLHYALRDEKVGRKYFSWAQSGQGEIWVDLLTDSRGQYVELQSGRLFNQNLPESVLTPFKQILFTPYSTDEWNEYWMPFAGLEEVDDMTLKAIVDVDVNTEEFTMSLYPLQRLAGNLILENEDGRELDSCKVDLSPAHIFTRQFELPSFSNVSRITLDGYQLWSSDAQEIDRPVKTNGGFSLESAQGRLLYAKYSYGMRKYEEAENHIDKALDLDPALLPALAMKSMLCARSLHYSEAYDYANRALAIDAYDPYANYVSAQVAVRMGKIYDAMDRFEIAALTTDLRTAAYTSLAKLYYCKGMYDIASDYVYKSLSCNQNNVTAYFILYQINHSAEVLEKISKLDPLSHFPDMERMISGEISEEKLASSIFEEMKWQNYIEMASFYLSMGLDDKAAVVLDACPEQNALVALWSAWLADDISYVSSAESKSIDFVFPFREESVAPLRWAVENNGGWRSRYLLSMLLDFLGAKEEALELMALNDSDYAPYYSFRAKLTGKEEDMKKAVSLDSDQWRYRQDLALRYYREERYDEALDLIERYYHKYPENFHIGDTYVKVLIAMGKYKEADAILSDMKILPFEGQTGTRIMYRDIKLHLAADFIDKGRYGSALAKIEEAKEWPTSLGVGKPYDDLIDNGLENVLAAILYFRQGDKVKTEKHLSEVKAHDRSGSLMTLYEKSTKKRPDGTFEKVESLLGNLNSSTDKKLF